MIEHLLLMDVRHPWFWATQAGAELDLLVHVDGDRVGVEIKRTDQPRLTPSMRRALADLELDRLIVVHAGEHSFSLAPEVDALPANHALTLGLHRS